MKLRMPHTHLSEKNKILLVQIKDILLVLMTLIDFLFIFIITFFTVPYRELVFMSDFDLVVCILLFINLIELYMKSDDGLWPFIKTHIIDILSIIPFSFIFLRYLAVFRLVRLIRVLQIFQIFKIYNLRNYDFGALKYFIQNRLLKILTVIIIFYVILSSFILTEIDPSFTSLFDSFWYNVVTLTGVGYGDITPLSYPGKVMGMLSIIMGVLFVSIFTAAMSALYMEKPEEETRHTVRVYINQLKQRNKVLQGQIDKLDKDIEELHIKLDVITKLLEEQIEKENQLKEEKEDETRRNKETGRRG